VLTCIPASPGSGTINTQILHAIKETLNPLGVAVVIEAQHLCMMMRVFKNKIPVTRHRLLMVSFMKNATAANS